MLCLLLVGIKERKKEKRDGQGDFYPRARHTLLAVWQGVFAAVRCK
jgi:hypothetical protein